MADVPQVMCSDPHEMLGIGRRHLAVRDYPNAVSTLGKACELLAQKYGQQADECGDAYLWYGKSLLGLAREESGVLGDGIPQGADENQEDEEEDQDEDDGEDDGIVVLTESEEKDSEIKDSSSDTKTKEETENKDEAIIEKTVKLNVSNDEEKKVESMETDEAPAEPAASSSSKPSDEEAGPSSSAGPSGTAGPSTQEGDASSEEDEDEVENLQVAWEVLEIARDIFLKRGDKGKKDLADVYLYLGEVSLESETYDKAVIDMTKSLELFKELYRSDDRRIAETHYQIGLAHSLSNGFVDAITHFKFAATILEDRIKSLEMPAAAANDADVKKFMANDPFYSVDGEIKELKELLPEIQEKIQDMMDYKAEAIRSVRESLGLSISNGQSSSKENGTKAPETKTEEKKVSDISHLVRRKRKPSDDGKTEDASAAKKPSV